MCVCGVCEREKEREREREHVYANELSLCLFLTTITLTSQATPILMFRKKVVNENIKIQSIYLQLLFIYMD